MEASFPFLQITKELSRSREGKGGESPIYLTK